MCCQGCCQGRCYLLVTCFLLCFQWVVICVLFRLLVYLHLIVMWLLCLCYGCFFWVVTRFLLFCYCVYRCLCGVVRFLLGVCSGVVLVFYGFVQAFVLVYSLGGVLCCLRCDFSCVCCVVCICLGVVQCFLFVLYVVLCIVVCLFCFYYCVYMCFMYCLCFFMRLLCVFVCVQLSCFCSCCEFVFYVVFGVFSLCLFSVQVFVMCLVRFLLSRCLGC